MSFNYSSLIEPLLNLETPAKTTDRFSAAAWFGKMESLNVLVAGVGGIGSWLALLISRLNPRQLVLVDPDEVDFCNLAGQYFSKTQLGLSKVEAINKNILDFSDYSATAIKQKITEDTPLPRIVLCGFDNMEARKITFNNWLKVYKGQSNALFIDGRLAAETLQIFCMSGNDEYYIDKYQKEWLFSDTEVDPIPCSYKQTSYCANLIASLMTNLFINWVTNSLNPIVKRAIPFMTEYSAEQMLLTQEI